MREKEEVVSRDQVVVQGNAHILEELKTKVDEELGKALPALEAAQNAVNSIKREDIDVVKRYSSPPAVCEPVAEACMLLLREGKSDWASFQKVMSAPGFLVRLKDYDKDKVAKNIIVKLEVIIAKKLNDLPKLQGASAACYSIALWAIAIKDYYYAMLKVNPLREKQEKANAELEEALGLLKAKQDELQGIQDQLNKLNANFQETKDKIEELAALQIKCER